MGLALVRRSFRRHYQLPLVLTALLLAITACLGGGGGGAPTEAVPAQQLGHEAILAGQAYLACSQACADRGYCGTSADRGQVVLLSIPGPAAQHFDWAIPNNTAVTIEESRDETITLIASGETRLARFYRVTVPERGASAWVAGWCVASAPAQ